MNWLGLSSLRSTERAAFKTVDVFSQLLGKQLFLKDSIGTSAATDGYGLFVRKGGSVRSGGAFSVAEVFYRRVEHCLAHIVFDSNAMVRALFVNSYSKAIETACSNDGVALDVVKLARLIESIVVILEDARVTHNWGLLYPGSMDDLLDIKPILYSESRAPVSSSPQLLAFIIETAIRVQDSEATSTNYTFIERPLNEALRDVRGCAFDATLQLTKWLIVQAVDALVSERGWSRSEAMAYLSASVESADSELLDLMDCFVLWTPSNFDRSDTQMAQEAETALDAINTPIQDGSTKDSNIEESQRRTEEFVGGVLKGLDEIGNSWRDADKDLASVAAKVVFTEARDTRRYEPSESELSMISMLRARFIKVAGRERFMLEEVGTQPDLAMVIQQKASGRKQPVWIGSKRCRGFKAMILVDLSISMQAYIPSVNAAITVLREAMSFQYADVFVWGFQSTDSGRVDIVKFTDASGSYAIGLRNIGGTTPLHFAIRVATNFLKQSNDAAHLFAVTDGFPVFVDFEGVSCSTKSLVTGVQKEVHRSRRLGVGVTGVILQAGDCSAGKELPVEEIAKMFGSSRHWKIFSDKVDHRLVGLVANSFERYLKHG